MKILFLGLGLIITIFLFSGCGIIKPAPNPLLNDESSPSSSNEIINDKSAVSDYVDISVAEAKKMIDQNPNLIVIDVSPNYAKGHLPRSINYYVGDGSLDQAIPTLDAEAEYLVYCHVDSASILGAQKLINAGFKNVYRLVGNYQAWIDAGYMVEK